MSAGGVHRSASPSPTPSPSLQPAAQRQLPGKDGAAPLPHTGSVSPSAESLRSSVLQIPPPPQQPPRSSSSSLSLQQNSPSGQSSVYIPHLPPPPRPLSSPSLSTLVTVQPWSSSPQLSSKLVAAPRSRQQLQQQQQQQEQQQILRKYSDNNRYPISSVVSATNALRVDNNVNSKTSGVVTSLVDKDHHFRPMEGTVESGADAARVKFLQKDGGKEARVSSRERYLGCLTCVLFLACIAFLVVAFTRDAHYKGKHLFVGFFVAFTRNAHYKGGRRFVAFLVAFTRDSQYKGKHQFVGFFVAFTRDTHYKGEHRFVAFLVAALPRKTSSCQLYCDLTTKENKLYRNLITKLISPCKLYCNITTKANSVS